MIKFESYRSFEPNEWQRLLETCNGHPLHLPSVHLADVATRDLRYLVAKEDNATISCGLGLEVSRRILGWTVGGKTLSLPTALAKGHDVVSRKTELYRALAAFARGSGFARLVIQRNWGEDFSDEEGFSHCILSRGLDFTVDLTRTADELLCAMQKNHRKNVRRAERRGVEVVRDNSEDALLQLRNLQACSAGRKEQGFGVPDVDFYRRLHHSIYKSGLGDVLFAKIDGQYVAGLAYLSEKPNAQTVRSGSTDVGNDSYATYLLQYDLMVRLKAAGVRVLNIGAVPAEAVEPHHPQHGLYKFKRGFGGQPHIRTAVDIPLQSFAALENSEVSPAVSPAS